MQAVECVDEMTCKLFVKGQMRRFEFDRVFKPSTQQAEVFNDTKRPVSFAGHVRFAQCSPSFPARLG